MIPHIPPGTELIIEEIGIPPEITEKSRAMMDLCKRIYGIDHPATTTLALEITKIHAILSRLQITLILPPPTSTALIKAIRRANPPPHLLPGDTKERPTP